MSHVPEVPGVSPNAPGKPPQSAPNKPTLPKHWHYETTVAKVEDIIAQIESGHLELADVFDQFAIAIQHLHQCETFLSQRQQQMDLLIETLTDEDSGD